jgi:hypothetical protein
MPARAGIFFGFQTLESKLRLQAELAALRAVR